MGTCHRVPVAENAQNFGNSAAGLGRTVPDLVGLSPPEHTWFREAGPRIPRMSRTGFRLVGYFLVRTASAAMCRHDREVRMVGDALLSELERQEKYLAQLPENYEFPLFNARQAVESQRRSGYKDTAAASREIVDNAIEAGATHVDVVFDTAKAKNNKRSVTAVAFIDDGAGMSPRMARYALSWGGGTLYRSKTRCMCLAWEFAIPVMRPGSTR